MPFWFQILFNFNRQTIEIEHGTRLLKLTFLKIILFIFILRYICLRIYMYLKQLNVVYYPTAFLLPQPINPSSFYNLRNSNKFAISYLSRICIHRTPDRAVARSSVAGAEKVRPNTGGLRKRTLWHCTGAGAIHARTRVKFTPSYVTTHIPRWQWSKIFLASLQNSRI